MANIEIKLVKSLAGRKKNHIATAKSLGLKRINDVSVQPDNEATRGKIQAISYLVEVNESK
ncbi:MAG: 50S ribosomal protein L30 [Clostridia bacterium]|nr:50S ribosomal protein L30 [Clostridia bacterium]